MQLWAGRYGARVINCRVIMPACVSYSRAVLTKQPNWDLPAPGIIGQDFSLTKDMYFPDILGTPESIQAFFWAPSSASGNYYKKVLPSDLPTAVEGQSFPCWGCGEATAQLGFSNIKLPFPTHKQ
ncbi:hypothetical protein GH733_009690 [Mirounga leonina]|nr:hypothetical protein GH733_009690 [Mirounga leonina]